MRRDAAIRRIVALHTPGLRAEIREKRALLYGTDPGAASGIASHVRAASAIRRQGTRLIVIQDDVNALAVMDASGRFAPLLLPPGTDGRRSFDDTIGNKHLKMDLEAAVVLPDARVLAFGSGSTRARERIVVVESETGVQVRRAPGLYSRYESTATPWAPNSTLKGPSYRVIGCVCSSEATVRASRAAGQAAWYSTSTLLGFCDGWRVAGPFPASSMCWRSI